MNIDILRDHLYTVYNIAKEMGKSKVELSTSRQKIGIIDGSGFGNRLASCLEIIGPVSLMVDIEELPKMGKELVASRRLLRRVKSEFGTGFVDLLLGDSLYFNAPMFNFCLNELDTEILIKTDEVRRNVIQDAQLLFESNYYSAEIDSVSGFDIDREIDYTIQKCSGFEMNGVDEPVTIARVQETDKDGDSKEFWVVTTADYLTAEEMRELAYIRWDIEINGFKELNQKMNTKHMYSHDRNAWEAILLILFMAFNILEVFIEQSRERFYERFSMVKQTRKFYINYLRDMIKWQNNRFIWTV